MEAINGLPIPARSKVTFDPGGLHVMLRRFDRPLVAGQSIPLKLMFAEAGTRTVDVQVVDPGSATDGADASGSMVTEYDDAS